MRTKRLFTMIAAPAVVIVGLGIVWGYRNGLAFKQQIEAWADSLEHGSSPVEMHLPFVPVYLDGAKLGGLQSVVVQRAVPGAVDSLRIVVANARSGAREALQACHVRFDPNAFDRDGPMGLKHALTCAGDTNGLVRFGSVALGADATSLPLYLASEDVPCSHLSSPDAAQACTDVRQEVRRIRDQVRQEIRLQMHSVRQEVRASVRGN